VIGLDTNVLLRTIDQSDTIQSQAVDALLSDPEQGPRFVNLVVLCEFVWTLDRTYKRKRAEIAERLSHVLEAPEFEVERRELAARAVSRYRDGRADFADYVLAEINREAGCRATLTFDRLALEATDLFQPVSL
jgi:predicted nucleic-acid-binding protein